MSASETGTLASIFHLGNSGGEDQHEDQCLTRWVTHIHTPRPLPSSSWSCLRHRMNKTSSSKGKSSPCVLVTVSGNVNISDSAQLGHYHFRVVDAARVVVKISNHFISWTAQGLFSPSGTLECSLVTSCFHTLFCVFSLWSACNPLLSRPIHFPPLLSHSVVTTGGNPSFFVLRQSLSL